MSYSQVNSNSQYYLKKQIKDLIPGDIILHPVYRTDGLMLVNSNKELSTALISMIRKHMMSNKTVLVVPSKQVLHDFIESSNFKSQEFLEDSKQVATELESDVIMQSDMDDRIHPESSVNPISGNKDSFLADLLTQYPMWVGLGSKLESEKLKSRAQEAKNELIASMNSNQTFVDLINRIREYDDVLLIHSINTMCISLVIGLTLELNKEELFDLSVAALFTNVGFIEINKNDFLNFLRTSEHVNEQLKRHLEIFSEMTADYPVLRKKSIIYGILDHHEYYNGQGYPNAKKGEAISLFGRILSIAHNYDELVGGYNYQIGLHPIEALRTIYENIDNKYDQNILDIFMHRTTYFKLGEPLSLPNIQKGVIIGFDNFIKAPHLPIVKLANDKVINLAKS